MGTRLLIDHFQLRADLRVNAERFHQVAAFQRQWKQQRQQQQKKCSRLSRLMEMTRCYQLSGREDACVHGDKKKKKRNTQLPCYLMLQSVLEVVRYFRTLDTSWFALLTQRFMRPNNFGLVTNLLTSPYAHSSQRFL